MGAITPSERKVNGEPVALGNNRTDGTYRRAGAGDCLFVFDECPGNLLAKGVVAVTGVTRSATPHDRSVSFTRYDPLAQKTYYEVDRFTVMRLDLQRSPARVDTPALERALG